ncbi:MAG TPA: cytochrome c, partial [Casimicrobium sp.]|nr:cytochrome c [Casimicrobium sp.]
AGNRAVTMANTTNLIRVVLAGGFAPATTGNPQPHGMPPYYHLLSDAEIAKLLTFVRSSWGNNAAAVTDLDMVKYRNALRTP